MTVKDTETAKDFFARRAEVHRGWRHHLHQYPETAFEEHETAAFIVERLREMGIDDIATGLAGTGIVATLQGRAPGAVIGLRADMDALPIHEETNLKHRSKNDGVSHACGHDGHMTMLLAAAEYLAQTRDFVGTVRFIFQPAEEAEGGGQRMVEEGLFERFPVDAVFGLHNWPGLPHGMFAARPGPVMAAMDLFTIRITGQGVHAATPHLGSDAIVAAGVLITALQTIASRRVGAFSPAVVSLTQVHGGHSLNALPGDVTLQGTTRALMIGAATGIGRACVEDFARNGARIVVADLNESGAAEAAELARKAGAEASHLACDVRDEASVKAVIEAAEAEMGGIDTLVV